MSTHSEPVIHDVDIEVDARVVDEASKVDWHSVSEAEASSFGLALGLYRDVVHTHEKRRVAWGTAVGGNISMCVLAIACLVCGTSPWFALAVVAATQTCRALWLYLKVHQSARDVRALEQQAIDVARELACLHPTQD